VGKGEKGWVDMDRRQVKGGGGPGKKSPGKILLAESWGKSKKKGKGCLFRPLGAQILV